VSSKIKKIKNKKILVFCSQEVCEILEGGRDVKQAPVFASYVIYLVCTKCVELSRYF